VRTIEQRPERDHVARAQRRGRLQDPFALTQHVPRARPQRLGQALELRRLGLAQRSHSEKLARALTFGAALVVG